MQRHSDVEMGSERGFALVFAAVFALFGFWPLLRAEGPRLWCLALAGAILALGFLAPKLLAPANRLWFRFGLALGAIVAPIVMALLFYTTVTPIGLIMRATGHDPLRWRSEPDSKTYWIARNEPVGSMKHQF